MMIRNPRAAFTLVEILTVITLVSILSTGSVLAVQAISDNASYDKTVQRMEAIKTGLVGDLDTNKQGLREYYGYLGDVGSLPSTIQGLDSLVNKPAGVSAWALNSTANIGFGWRGPYLRSPPSTNWLLDAWGREITYVGGATPYILSLGADNLVGGSGSNADIRMDFTSSLTTASVIGVINKTGLQFADDNTTIALYRPDGSGALDTRPAMTQIINSAAKGYFTFPSVPFGLRALKVTLDSGRVIGPVLISVDNSNFLVPHNFLDSEPGSMPHMCNDRTTTWEQISGSLSRSGPLPAKQRIYFSFNATESMTMTSIYLSMNAPGEFVALRIGNETKTCDSAIMNGFHCKTRSGVNDTNDAFTNPDEFPEINLVAGQDWEIKAGYNIGAYIEFTDSTLINNITTLELRLGCKVVRLQ